ncbi:ornithine cyclodeaminase family protein [Undibacterium terreum]|uniref:Ornithine cyclodeaminase n=1 Tax=Undibacterium terreum TaxID=1224302 RepID=A0A916ULT7_9BURK|nr:ornithine cyclodeaminase family protein [Undibacterium terreum]GGC77214.1 ornithine cyclodeaminase [Undibacterium terreum]
MIPHISKEQVRQALPYPTLIQALRVAFTSGISAPQRHVHTVSEDPVSTLLLMPVWQPGANMGVKLVTVAPQNQGLPSVHAIFVLFDTVTGAPLALMDGEELTARRTAAASALASSHISRTDSKRLLMVGTGSLVPYLAAAHCTARDISEVEIWGRSPDKARLCMDNIKAQALLPPHIKLSVTGDLEISCRQADIISCATTSTKPIVPGAWVGPGTHVDLVGGFKPTMREVNDALMAKATIFVDTFPGALKEAGDITQPLANGNIECESIVADLADLAGGIHRGRSDDEEITVFKSVGTALEDLCAANLVWAQYQATQAT